MISANEYLRQIQRLDKVIDSKVAELAQLRELATSITATTDKEFITKSGVSDKIGVTVARIVDLEREISEAIDHFIIERTERIDVLNQIEDTLQYEVLHKHFVQYKTLTEIAGELHYSFQHIVNTKRKGLKKVYEIINKVS